MEMFWFFLAAVSWGDTVPEQHLTAWKGLRERATLPGTRVFIRSSIGLSDTEHDGPATGKRTVSVSYNTCYSNTVPSKKEPKTHERLDKERGVPVTQHQPLRLEGPLYCLLYGEQPPGSPKVTHLLSFTLILFLPILFPQLRWNA